MSVGDSLIVQFSNIDEGFDYLLREDSIWTVRDLKFFKCIGHNAYFLLEENSSPYRFWSFSLTPVRDGHLQGNIRFWSAIPQIREDMCFADTVEVSEIIGQVCFTQKGTSH